MDLRKLDLYRPYRVDDNQADSYEYVNQPAHYNKYGISVIEIIEKIAGPFITAQWCKYNAFKYRMRMGEKPGQDVSRELAKEEFYLKKHAEYLKKAYSEQINFSSLTEEEKWYIAEIYKTSEKDIREYVSERFCTENENTVNCKA